MSHFYNNYGNIKDIRDSNKFCCLKKVIQILLSLSVLSFLLIISHSYSLVHSYGYFVSNVPINLAERNCIFLLCNGILALIIRTSGVMKKISPLVVESKGGGGSGDHPHHAEEVHDQGPGFDEQNKKPKIERKDGGMGVGNGVEGGVDLDDNGEEEIEDWEEEEGIDELNKKCEDFIKKVKQEIKGA